MTLTEVRAMPPDELIYWLDRLRDVMKQEADQMQ
jgi:hypothetical protein